jgi:hypothetical protein
MIRLYKRDGDGIHYWQAWRHQRIVVLHWGRVGEKGRTRQIRLRKGQTAKAVIEEAARQPNAEGYAAIDVNEHSQVAVQYRTIGWGSVGDLDKRHRIEDLLDDCLAWTCNGFCDGGDIGSGEMNVFCLVVNPEAAKNTLVSTLKKNRLLKGAVIAVREGETYRVLWPDGYAAAFSLL